MHPDKRHPWRAGHGIAAESLKNEAADRYAFYNAGVKAALLDDEVNALLRRLEAQGSLILLCGTCLDHFGLTETLTVGKNACIGDVRESMAMDRVDYL